jgi:hypothetical protein
MSKWIIKYEPNNIWVTREFPELHQTLSRVIARVEGWEKNLMWAKRNILEEARLLGWKKKREM